MLAAEERWGGAGHLVGFAAECAVKFGIASLRPGQDSPKGRSGHFPELVESAKKLLTGRRNAALLLLLQRADLMGGWMINLRYANDSAVGQAEYLSWREHAGRLVGAVGLRRR